jgi:hypothetical protein
MISHNKILLQSNDIRRADWRQLLHCFQISLKLMHKQETDEEMMQNEKQPEHEHSEETKNNKKMMTKMKQESKKEVKSYACDSIDIQGKMDHDKDLFSKDDDDS